MFYFSLFIVYNVFLHIKKACLLKNAFLIISSFWLFLGLLPLLVLVEFISYLSRNVSLALRLAANNLSGKLLLNNLSGFTYNKGFIYFLSLIP